MELNQALIYSGFLEQVEAALRQKLAVKPDDAQILESLGHLYRMKGEVEAAATIYGHLRDQHATHPTAAYLHAVLTGDRLPVPEPTVLPWPAPFVRLRHFLPQAQRDRLFDLACAYQHAFEPMKLYKQLDDGSTYAYDNSSERQQVGLSQNREVDEIVKSKVFECLPDYLARLQTPPFPIGDAKLALVLSHSGQYSRPHQDDYYGHLKVSLLYYVHKQPKAFSGGDLLLYDTDIKSRTYNPNQFTRIPHEDNILVLFPSCYFHEVTRVRCQSEAFEDGRFAVTAGISTAEGGPSARHHGTRR